MSPIKRYFPDKEKELHEIVKSNLTELEDGLKLLQHEYPTGKGIVDLLCVDAGGRLVIIEVKLHEDENALYQVLKYYSEIENSRYQIANLFKKMALSRKKRLESYLSPNPLLMTSDD